MIDGLKIIGRVRNAFYNEGQEVDWYAVESVIVMKLEFAEGLKYIENFPYIWVIFWLDGITGKERNILKFKQTGNLTTSLDDWVGVFATHVAGRPNPIGISLVDLTSRVKNLLCVKNLDAFAGTPVLDIKPFFWHRREIPRIPTDEHPHAYHHFVPAE